MRILALLIVLTSPLRAQTPPVPSAPAETLRPDLILVALSSAPTQRHPHPPALSAAAEAAERGRLALNAVSGDSFDGSAARESAGTFPDLSLSWGSAPRATVHSRNIESRYGLYGAGRDALLKTTGINGPVARAAKAPADMFLAWTAVLAGHELGHFEQAWLGGGKDVAYVSAPGPSAFGRVTEIGDWSNMGPAGIQAFFAGGVQASQAAAAQLRRDIFESGAAHWSQWPLFFFQKLDVTKYALQAPKPSAAGAADFANDMTNYARLYGGRSGRGGDAVHADIARGAVWNALDPLGVYSLWGYARHYVLSGEERQSVPGVEIGERAWTAGTGFWLAETGPRYSLSLLSRGRGGDLLEVTPSWGEGQPGLGAYYSDRLAPGWRGRAGMELWRQREAAEPGPLKTGGAVELGLRRERRNGSKTVYLDASAGYKTEGAMLGQRQDEGAFWTLSVGGASR
ncbi:MAG: hypothetical protein AAB262_15445 [Elusimicrobiota bacterium]